MTFTGAHGQELEELGFEPKSYDLHLIISNSFAILTYLCVHTRTHKHKHACTHIHVRTQASMLALVPLIYPDQLPEE